MIYKKQDINRIFTEKVSELIAQGFQINPATMGGSQGEIAHVDLCRGDEILRILLGRDGGWGKGPECLVLAVGCCTQAIRNDNLTRRETIWNGQLEILSEIKFASATRSLCDTPVYLDLASGQEAEEKRERRWKARQLPNRRELPDASKLIALRYLRKQKGFKTCRISEIESVVRIEQQDWRGRTNHGLQCYEIKARGKTFELHPRTPA